MAELVYHFHSHRIGTLLADALATPIRFIIDGKTGDLAFPADRNTFETDNLVLFIPEEDPDDGDALQLLLTAREIDGDATGLRDRWTAYHGPPDPPLFASCCVEGGKFNGEVIEGPDLAAVNTVRAVEGRLLKKANADKSLLRSTCSRRASVKIPEPVAVGIDQFGIEVRATFGIVRIYFAEPASDATDAEHRLDLLMGDHP